MSININRQSLQNSIAIDQNNSLKKNSGNIADKKEVQNPHKDSVQLTSQAVSLNKMQKQASSESQVDMKRVETLKAAILKGDYKINSAQLAENIGKFENGFSDAYPS